jgi:DNA-binding PadR family transcriptional regulator
VAADRPLAEWVCLAIVDEGPTHGWAVARLLAPDGDVGRVWSLSRALTYKALDRLLADGLIAESGVARGAGPARTMLASTPAGRRALRWWLRQPIDHLRDVRGELLCKLVLGERRGMDTVPLLDAQQAEFAPNIDSLARRAQAPDADVVDRWRAASSQAVRRFLEAERRRQSPR